MEIVDIKKEMQIEQNKHNCENYILEQTLKNPKIINNLSEKQKRKLIEIYDKEIKKNNDIIMKNNKKN